MNTATKMRWLFVLLLALGPAGAATRSTEKIQIVYRGEEGGPWRVFIFGANCQPPMKVAVTQDSDPNQPLELVCR